MTKIKIALCDDIEHLCKYFKMEIDNEDDMETVGIANSGNQCIDMVNKLKPDVLLLDIQMETNDAGITAIPEIIKVSPATKIIILTIHEYDKYVFKALTLGAMNFLIKTAPIVEIISTIRAVYDNTTSLSPKIARLILDHCEKVSNQQQSVLFMFNLMKKLTTSEFEVLSDLYYGKSYKDISQERSVEESTIRSQATRIVKKFNESNMKSLIKNLKATKAFEIFLK